jgi:hypothetical protein
MAQAAGTWVLLGRAHGWLAEIELSRDDPHLALQLAEAGLSLSTRYGYLFDAALCSRALGQAQLALGDRSAAHEHLLRARSGFAEIGAKPELARTERAIAAL